MIMTNYQKNKYYEDVWLWVRVKGEDTTYIDNLIEIERKRAEDFEEKEKLLLRIKDIMEMEEDLKKEFGEDIKFHNYNDKNSING